MMKSSRVLLGLAALAAMLSAGCVTTRVDSGREAIVCITAEQARTAGTLRVSSEDGAALKIPPARPGQVTVVVFFSMDIPLPRSVRPALVGFSRGSPQASRDLEAYMARVPLNTSSTACAKHVRDLVRKYGSVGVRAFGVVEKTYDPQRKPFLLLFERTVKSPTDSYRLAPLFIRAKGINFPVYYDDFSALGKMIKTARAVKYMDAKTGMQTDPDDEDAVAMRIEPSTRLPVLFVIDRQERIRLVRTGFDYSSGGAEGVQEAISDLAPEGQRVEDVIKQLLEER